MVISAKVGGQASYIWRLCGIGPLIDDETPAPRHPTPSLLHRSLPVLVAVRLPLSLRSCVSVCRAILNRDRLSLRSPSRVFFPVVRVRYSAVKTRPTPLPFLLLCITLCPPLGRPSYSGLPFFVRDDVVGQGAALHWTGVDCRDYPSSAVGLLSTASMPPSSDRLELF